VRFQSRVGDSARQGIGLAYLTGAVLRVEVGCHTGASLPPRRIFVTDQSSQWSNGLRERSRSDTVHLTVCPQHPPGEDSRSGTSYGEPQASVEDRKGPLVSVGPNRFVTPLLSSAMVLVSKAVAYPRPGILAGQPCGSPASTAAWTRTSSRIPHRGQRDQIRRTRLRRSHACHTRNTLVGKTDRFDTPTRYW